MNKRYLKAIYFVLVGGFLTWFALTYGPPFFLETGAFVPAGYAHLYVTASEEIESVSVDDEAVKMLAGSGSIWVKPGIRRIQWSGKGGEMSKRIEVSGGETYVNLP